MDFNPDAYLAEKSPDQSGFDPDAYLAQKGQDTTALGAAGRGALDAVPFGDKAYAAVAPGDYNQNLSSLDQMIATDKQEHPIAHDVGEVGGTIAPFAIPGVGEVLGAESLAGRAAVGAGLGALQGASNNRNSDDLGKDVLENAALGAVLNPVAGAAGDAISGGLSKAAPALEDIANSKAVQAANLDPKTLGLPHDELQALGQKIRDYGLVGGDDNQNYEKAQTYLKVAGEKIGEMGEQALPVSYGSAYMNQFTDPLQAKAEQSAKVFGLNGNHDLQVYRQGIANMQNIDPTQSTFKTLQDLKSSYGEKAFNSSGQVKDPAYANVYGQVKNAMKSLIQDSPDEYQNVMNEYSTLKDISNGLEKKLQATQAMGGTSKGFGMAGRMAGSVLGGNPGATGALAAALAPAHPLMALGVGTSLLTNPNFMAKAAGGLSQMAETGAAKSLNNVALTVTNGLLDHPAMAPFRGAFQGATQGLTDPSEIGHAHTVTDYLLSQNTPAYAATKAKVQEQQ